MKRLTLLFALIAFTLNANGQSFEIGSQNLHIGVSSIDSQQSAFAGVSYAHPIKGILTTRFSLAAGVIQTDSDARVYNQSNDSYRYNGVTDTNILGFVRPSVMAGVKIPVSNIDIGLYTGYQTTINSSIDHRFVPVSVVMSF